ncbi:hypothetical protein AWB91_10575 [Mycobacterium paraense]|uniref:DUF8174 domain-containing protein n=1 Tax=Mycobacterium paraense TaxID=767916 RepID=A0A1X2ADC0_9MYCO|nr:hypothetical protein [Mycobacterium paraense]MCV7443297.1 hypothetical protein [Mycobacterium paraense]ORW32401.1 hypothetical protein AWB91_10575 [Mycobacterium paraense]ORW38215.1 hypothetical protein AWB89_24010 [Mycobacterium paraense]ORW43607.1 hypothetical protein AWB88_07385 [Mycobacterium paraense]ORW49245.1 hypothetical protein AWB90_10150 [Mycobacterium paraense]
MAGPHPPDHTVGATGPTPHAESRPLEFPGEPPAAAPPTHHAADYGGPPVPYPTGRPKRRLLIGALMAVALIAATTLAIAYGVRTNGANTGTSFSEAAAKSAIQDYLDALEHRNIDVIVRNALCGMYDAVRDKRSDVALAKMSSDALRKQFSEVQLMSVDKIVYLSQYQAQALFTMRVAPADGSPTRTDVQGMAQLLFQRGQIMVCAYVLRTGGSY